MIFTFIWHLVLAAGFTILLYLVATYTSLCHEMAEVKRLKAKLDSLMNEGANENHLTYYKRQYNLELKRFNERRGSPFAKIILLFTQSLNQNFSYLD